MKLPLLVGLLFLMFRVTGQSPCQPPTAYTELEVNNVRAGLLNGGDLWWDLTDPKYEVPIGSGKTSLFAGGLWVGGIDTGGQLMVAAQLYRLNGTDFWPGPLGIPDAATESVCLAYDRFWKVNRSELQQYDQLRLQYLSSGDSIPLNQIPQSILDWPASGNPYAKGNGNVSIQIPVSKELAPYVDVDGVQGYDPTKGDYPAMRGDETVWWVFNDAGNVHEETGGAPLNIEVKAKAYAKDGIQHVEDATFYQFQITNHGAQLDSTYIGLHIDADIGHAFDDFIGCDTSRDLGITYNGDDFDDTSANGYGKDPPMVGIDILKGPVGDGGKRHGMDVFMFYNNDFSVIGIPEQEEHFYQYMNAQFKDGTPLSHNGMPVRYAYPDDPDQIGGWSECMEGNNPNDKRMIISAGPFTFKEGETKTLDFAAVWSRCTRPIGCPSFDCIQAASDGNQDWFDNLPPLGAVFNPQDELVVLQIQPNPSVNRTTISWFETSTEDQILRVYNLQGQLLYSARILSGGQAYDLEVSNFEQGIYLIQLTSKGGLNQTAKLMVTR